MPEPHTDSRAKTTLSVGIGGFAGSILRYLISVPIPGLRGTLLVNTLGSFALGLLAYMAISSEVIGSRYETALSAGVLSSFTTYSTFAVQTAQQPLPWAVGNVVASYALGFTGVLVARSLVRRLDGRRI